MGTFPRLWLRLLLTIAILCFGNLSHAQLSFSVSRLEQKPTDGNSLHFSLNALNPTSAAIDWTPPAELSGTLSSSKKSKDVVATRIGNGSVGTIAPGSFVRTEYEVDVPEGWSGEVSLELSVVPGVVMLFPDSTVAPGAGALADSPTTAPRKGFVYFLKGRRHAEFAGDYDPDTFFKQHISGHEPLYFIAGTKTPNAKFQISFKYRLLNENGWLAEKAEWLTGFHLAYSQTSLWDLNAPSAPFFDSSYRPELLYSWDRVVGGNSDDWFRLDLQGGVQHESNGRAEPESRSLNIVYLRPRLIFGRDTGFQLTLSPRAWIYIGDLSDNPDLEDYRGYADLRAVLGWQRGLQVSALGRIGNRLRHGSATIDITYPLMQPPAGSFSIYLHGQYFIGYGESLVGYRDRSEIFRAGISLFR